MILYLVAIACFVVVCGIGYVIYDLVYSPDWSAGGPEKDEDSDKDWQ